MGRPVGSKNKPRDVDEQETSTNETKIEGLVENGSQIVQEVKKDVPTKSLEESKDVQKEKEGTPKNKTPREIAIEESRKALNFPAPPGQKFFEAPDGFVILAEDTKTHVLYRAGNDGQGMIINPKR